MTVRYKNFRTGDVLDIESTKGIYHACNVNIEDKKTGTNHPYVVRTSQNNGLRGYIEADESTLNPGRTISFAQDTAQMFYQDEPYFTGNKVKVMFIKGREMTENIALFLIACLNKAFNMFGWGQSYDVKILRDVELSLPVMTVMVPDWVMLETLLKVHGGGGVDMSKIDTSSWKKFKLDDILERISCNKLPYRAGELPKERTRTHTLAAVTAGVRNQGISCYVPTVGATVLKDCISISANGDGVAFWHPDDFTILQDAYAVTLKGGTLTEPVALFFVSCIQKLLTEHFGWNNKSGWNKLKEYEILLPARAEDVPDWDYMQERIAELEQERIAELEQYLIATGLNDYTLTDEDLNVLALFRGEVV